MKIYFYSACLENTSNDWSKFRLKMVFIFFFLTFCCNFWHGVNYWCGYNTAYSHLLQIHAVSHCAFLQMNPTYWILAFDSFKQIVQTLLDKPESKSSSMEFDAVIKATRHCLESIRCDSFPSYISVSPWVFLVFHTCYMITIFKLVNAWKKSLFYWGNAWCSLVALLSFLINHALV